MMVANDSYFGNFLLPHSKGRQKLLTRHTAISGRTRESAPQVLSTIRNTVIGLLRIAGNSNIAAALRRNAARPDIPLRLVGANPVCP